MTELKKLPESGHWTDNHILFDVETQEFVAFDEAGLEHGRYKTRAIAIYALEKHEETLHLPQAERDRLEIFRDLC
jgi:hypothetical protein